MGQLQNCTLTFILSLCVPAFAEWGLVVGAAGFQGTASAGIVYEWSGKHAIECTMGSFQMGGRNETQINAGYRYTPFHIRFQKLTWAPLSLGTLVIYAVNQRDYFTKSPSKYPAAGYYEQTGLRLGAEVTTQLHAWAGRARFLYKLILMDSGAIALYNNDGRYAENFLATGLSLQYFF